MLLRREATGKDLIFPPLGRVLSAVKYNDAALLGCGHGSFLELNHSFFVGWLDTYIYIIHIIM